MTSHGALNPKNQGRKKFTLAALHPWLGNGEKMPIERGHPCVGAGEQLTGIGDGSIGRSLSGMSR